MGRPATGSKRERPKGSGRWELRIPLAADPLTRARDSLSRVFHGTEAQAQAKLEELMRIYGGREITAASDSLSAMFEEWIASPTASGRPRAASTVYQETRRFDRHVRPAFGAMRPATIKAVDINRLYNRLLKSGLSASSVRRVHQLLSALYVWGESLGYTDGSPMAGVRAPAAPPPTPVAPTVEVVDALLEAAAEHDPEVLLMLRLGAVTAARRSELVGLRWDCIDLDEATCSIEAGVVVVPGEHRGAPRHIMTDTKTGEAGTLSLDAETVELLHDHLERQRDAAALLDIELPADAFVFASDPTGTRSWHPDTLSARMRKLADTVPGAASVTLKSLRAFVASELAGDGIDEVTATAVLRHRSAQTTARHYKAARAARVRSATKGLGERLGKKRD